VDFVGERGDLLLAIADVNCGDASVATHNHHVRDRVYVIRSTDVPVGIADECQVDFPQGALNLPKALAVFLPIHGEYLHLRSRRYLLDLREHAHFLPAWWAPGSPKGDDDDLAAVVAELHRAPEHGRWRIADFQFRRGVSRSDRQCASQQQNGLRTSVPRHM